MSNRSNRRTGEPLLTRKLRLKRRGLVYAVLAMPVADTGPMRSLRGHLRLENYVERFRCEMAMSFVGTTPEPVSRT